MSNNSYYNDQWRIINEPNQNKVSNYCMDFDSATNEEINCGNSSSFSFGNGTTDSPFSVSFWINPNSISTGTTGFFQKGTDSLVEYGILFYLNKIRFRLKSQTNNRQISIDETAATALVAGSWSNVVVTYSGVGGASAVNGMEMYINGNQIAVTRSTIVSPNGYVAMNNLGSDLFIASRGGLGHTNADYTDFIVFNYELSQAQVTTLYGGGTALTNPMSLSPAPVAYYQLGDQSVDNGANYLVPNNSLNGSEGYSPYALSFDGTSNFLTLNNASNPFNSNTTLLGGTTSFTISAWFKQRVGNVLNSILGNYAGGFNVRSFWLFTFESNQIIFRSRDTNNNEVQISTPNNVVTAGSWQHISVTYDASDLKIFLNGVEKNTLSVSGITINTSLYSDTIGSDDQFGGNFFDGELSNVAVWRNSVINPVTLYNNGKPANLNNLSTKPSYWFQLGSNSSFDSNTSKWTCLNEGTEGTIAMPLNATTYNGNMTNDQITNGVGYSANGLGTSSIDIVGDAPYSSGNGLSENMDVLDRVKDTPPT